MNIYVCRFEAYKREHRWLWLLVYLSTTYAYIYRGECAKAVAVNLVAAAVHPSAYDNRHTRSCPKINVQLCKRNESLLKEGNVIWSSFTQCVILILGVL